MQKYVIASLALILVGLGLLHYDRSKEAARIAETEGRPTDIVKIGSLAFSQTGAQDSISLVSDGTTYPLIIDAESMCTSVSGGAPCAEMSSLYSAAFKDKDALVEGYAEGDTIRVRKLFVVDDASFLLPYGPGRIYIAWPVARALIENCEAAMVMQTHAHDVIIQKKGGGEVVAIAPRLDEVFDIVQDSAAKCGQIPVATE